MTCPKCEGAMEPVEFEGIEVDRCTKCGGLWFDLLEHEDLKALEGSEAIDTGDAAKGRERDEQKRVLCPKDGARMIPMVDREQPQIWLESCPVCYGVYLDAGEFRAMKSSSFTERVLRPRPF